MIFNISSTYYSEDEHPIVEAWKDHLKKGNENYSFRDWLKREAGSDRIYGDFEEGWRVYWEKDEEAAYIWFVLRWS
jgi:hypothetical protein